ncbi:MAG: hypothetical protein ACI8PB_001843 [Desulforhopalus sp.]|jgi:hypothetical protein
MSQEYIPFTDLIAKIEELCTEKATGIFFIATKANRSAQIVIENGAIVFVYFYNKQGQEALELMLSIQAGRYRFQKYATSPRRNKLPPTKDILNFLYGKRKTKSLKEAKAHTQLTDKQKQILETVLADYIGPMAAIICEDHLDSVPDLASAIEALASEMPSPEQGQKFRIQIEAKLN